MSLLSDTTLQRRHVGHSLVNTARSRSYAVWQAILAQLFTPSTRSEERMSLDTESHWHWSNPVNFIPGFVLLVILVIGILL